MTQNKENAVKYDSLIVSKFRTDKYWQENENDYSIRFYVAGVEKDDISVTLEQIPIYANSYDEVIKVAIEDNYFTALVPVNADVNKISTTYKNGLLKVTIAKNELTKPVRLSILN